jgi:hypothetical protein
MYTAFALSRRASTVSNGGCEEEGEEEKKKPEFLEPAPKRRHIESIAKNLSGRLQCEFTPLESIKDEDLLPSNNRRKV